ncbi:hypothetical protein COY13_03540 [Candidatus Roizmanbacteria bacterium CG_4_10_14_0_2_um_filter_36_35]|uniref:Uncharacterized protein n=2 Tax=Candidatus Roizmaniibacteriota TaxID=1752723 RepID=A0A2M7BXT9_9BACT|nr:MAG: hypothetical protein COS50_00630 [Candidatus Roizmanbacteria bacterium CG03_land_8_20_14_0_80_35_26]PIZ67304.1 MAG: hypothetical protein COY13_03540 [Candidatus Roizmanbacteria bacterium CG_4_10_14_0_2_um_filter_36_35]
MVVRAGNGCAPGPFSGEVSTTPGGGFIAGAPAGFLPGVLGATTEELTPSPTPQKGEIKGIEVQTCSCRWFLIVLGEIIALIAYFLVFKNKKTTKLLLLSILIPILTQIGFVLINKCFVYKYLILNNAPDFVCKYFILINFILFLTFLKFWRKRNG